MNNNKLLETISKKYVVTLGLIILFAVSAVFTIHNNFSQPNAMTSVYGAHAKNSLVSLSANSYSQSKTTSASDTKRVSLTATIENLQQSDLQVSPGLQFYVVDANGKEYPYTAQYLPENTSIGGPLPSLASRAYNLHFDVSSSAIIKKLKFQTDGDSQPVYVRL